MPQPTRPTDGNGQLTVWRLLVIVDVKEESLFLNPDLQAS
jgi:hypothetical protein